jgi:hypothetical protein
MPSFDLRRSQSELDNLAAFKVLAVMCHPSDRAKRERMVALIQSETGEGPARRKPVSNPEFSREINLSLREARVAGGLLLTRIQLHLNGFTPSLNRALPLVRNLLPKWDQPTSSNWSRDAHIGHSSLSRAKMLKAYARFGSVAHFWGAMLHGEQHGRKDIWPGSLETLPKFVAYANSLLDLACAVPSPESIGRFAMTRSKAWSFIIPDHLVETVRLDSLPFSAEQKCILDER